MKKLIFPALVLTLCLSLFAGCGGGAEQPDDGDSGNGKSAGEINVCNWGEYIDESIFEEFEEQTGITVNYSTAQSNEVLYSLLKSGGGDYDIIIPSDYLIARLIDEDMIQKLDFSNIPNYELIGEDYKNLEYDPTGEYSVAYMWGTVGIIYNTTMIEDEITGWDALFDEKYSGQILMIDNPRDALGIALKELGYSLNTTDEAEINEAYELLVSQKPIVQGYVMDQIYNKLEGGEAAIGVYYAGDYITMLENNPDLAYVHPEEGFNYFVDAMCVLKNAPNKEGAEKFINFMCSTEIAKRNMDVTGYVSANTTAAEEYSAENYGDLENAVLFPTAEQLESAEVFLNLPQETLDLYNDLWAQLKA